MFEPSIFAFCAKVSMLLPSGQCYTWNEAAYDFFNGKGNGAILLQPFDAYASSGNVYANVLGTSVLSDGK